MKKITSLFIFACCLPVVLFSQYVGIGTETPTAMLDINGDVVFRTSNLEVEDSLTLALDVNTDKFSSYRITEADSAFILAGITSAMDGRVITLINQTGEPMTLHHMDTLAEEENQMVTGNHEDIVLEDMGTVSMQYDTAMMKWIINNSSQIPAGASVWDTTGADIFFENFVGIGTDEPTAPLSIETELDEIGFSHMAGEDSITVASSVSELSGAVGTTTNHMFSLNSNNEGALHILPQGNTVLGSTAMASQFAGLSATRMTEFDSKLTVFTSVGDMGILNIAGDDEIKVAQGTDSWLGAYHHGYIGTISNHPFRIKAGNNVGMNLFPTRQLVMGSILDSPFDSARISVYTGNNTDGFTQIGGEGQRLALRIGGSSAGIGTWSTHILRIISNSVGRMHILPDGRITVSPNDYAPQGQFSVYQLTEGQNAITAVTPNNTNGFTQYGASGQVLVMRVGGPFGSAGVGTHSDTHLRLQCNSQNALNIISPSLNVGIGIDFPSEKLTVRTPAGGFGISHRADGGEVLTTHIAGGATSIGTWSNHPFRLRCNSQDVINLTTDAKVGIGTWTPQQKLDVNGTIRSKEIIVELINWPDYVFNENYQLTSLNELEKFIEENHHLPNIPSAKEIESNGQYVGALQQKMMEKIEELTLHIIELNKRIETLEQRNP